MTEFRDMYARARERMDRAKERFTQAARAALDGDPRAGSLACDALRELEQARAALRDSGSMEGTTK